MLTYFRPNALAGMSRSCIFRRTALFNNPGQPVRPCPAGNGEVHAIDYRLRRRYHFMEFNFYPSLPKTQIKLKVAVRAYVVKNYSAEKQAYPAFSQLILHAKVFLSIYS
jgi:hypothetical protein